MAFPIVRVLMVAGLAAMAGCQQERNNTSAVAPVGDVPNAAGSAVTTAQPAQVPAGDPSLPGHENPNVPTGLSADGSSGTDGAHSALTKGERDNAMPLEGQSNSYSSDASAKRGNEQIPRETAGSPRGDEAVSTPNSYPKESK